MPVPRRFCLFHAVVPLSLALLVVWRMGSAPLAWAQAASSITGTVTDVSGAAVPGARVTVVEVNTGQHRVALTNSQGNYVVPFLPVGTYRVLANKAGFAQEVRTGIHLAVDQAAT